MLIRVRAPCQSPDILRFMDNSKKVVIAANQMGDVNWEWDGRIMWPGASDREPAFLNAFKCRCIAKTARRMPEDRMRTHERAFSGSGRNVQACATPCKPCQTKLYSLSLTLTGIAVLRNRGLIRP